jgi:YD repeat-containing protein
MRLPCRQRTVGEETLGRLYASETPTTRVHSSCHREVAPPRAATFQYRAHSLVPCLLAVCLTAVTAVHAASNVVRYTYDAVGNIVAIQRINTALVSIADFAPSTGAAGTAVTITGTGFSATTAGNAVAFNGVAAVVTVATATTLAVTVPAGASTGKITVAVGGSTAISAQDFVVAPPGAPTITAFAPAAGGVGTAVTVTGTNFDPAAGATSVKLNQSPASASSVAATLLTFAVPAATGSGRIRVTTGGGSAVSIGDFIVPPVNVAAADIIVAARLVPNGAAQGIDILAASKYGAVLFDGNVGDWLSLQLGSFAINPAGGAITYTVYKPDNTQLSSGTLSSTALSIHLPQLPVGGTYAVLLGTGIAQVSLDLRLETNRLVPADGTTLAVARSAGQTTRALIAAVAGEQSALMVSGMTIAPAGTGLDYTIALPNGGTFRRGTAFGLGSTSLLPPFTVTGTHTVTLAPNVATTQSAFQVRLVAGTPLPVDGVVLDLAIANPGEGARLTFAGFAGENLGFGMKSVALTPASAGLATFAVYRPDASLLASGRCFTDDTECSANLASLPVSGTYSVIVQPANGASGTMRMWMSHDVTETLTSGTPRSVSLARPGQNARLGFAGVAGASLAIQIRGITTTPAGQGILAQVNKPDGSLLAYAQVTGFGQTLVLPPLPVTGQYALLVEPEPAGKGSATAQMEVLLDPGQAIAIDGAILTSTIPIAGGSARYTFAGTAGQNLGLGIGSVVLNPSSGATVSVYRPDGTTLTAVSCSGGAGGCGGNLTNLPTSGTYALVAQPVAGATGSFSIALSTDTVRTLTVGTPRTINLGRPGRNARLNFTANAGQTLRLDWSGIAIAGAATSGIVYLYHPNGSTLGSAPLASGVAGSYDLPALPATGTYTLFVDPAQGATLSATFTLRVR